MYVLHYAPDNASLILRLALEEIGAPYRTLLVDRTCKAQRDPGYLAINPNGLIPTLVTPNGPIFETGAALLWLVDTHEALGPAPSAPDRGDFLKWLFFCSNTLHAGLRTLFYPEKYVGNAPSAIEALCRQVQENTKTALTTLDRSSTPRDAPDVIDIYTSVCLRWCALYGPEDHSWFRLKDTPVLAEVARRLEDRASTLAVIKAEGLGDRPFTAPIRPNPPEGSPL